MPRDFLLKIRVSGEEHDAIKTTAADAGLTVSDYVRMRLAHQRVRQTAAERDTLTHLARIGSNINQIARWANTHANQIEALEILMRLDGLQADIRKITEPTCT
ncbi:MobC family plasmid mobilization relaxosome protein [Deltaproteobacteria bacterium OttesenSCG-928-K17]|nr:MobC family plasmid mobilization relaxosome protein [Deltaproteobacteria bacterium OttesenSCG-928-K17]